MVDLTKMRRQTRLVSRLLGSVVRAPQVLLYPLVGGVVMFATPFAILGVVVMTLGVGFSYLALVVAPVVLAVVYPVLKVAYCYEINEVFEGRSPSLGAGFGVAHRRWRAVLVTGSLLLVASPQFPTRLLDSVFDVDGLFGSSIELGVRVASVFAMPAIATTEATPRETLREVQTAVERTWGAGMGIAVGTEALGTALAWTGIGVGFPLGMLSITGVLRASVPPLGPLTIPIAIVVSGFVGGVVAQFAVTGIVGTALYRHATDGQVPASLPFEEYDLVDVDT